MNRLLGSLRPLGGGVAWDMQPRYGSGGEGVQLTERPTEWRGRWPRRSADWESFEPPGAQP